MPRGWRTRRLVDRDLLSRGWRGGRAAPPRSAVECLHDGWRRTETCGRATLDPSLGDATRFPCQADIRDPPRQGLATNGNPIFNLDGDPLFGTNCITSPGVWEARASRPRGSAPPVARGSVTMRRLAAVLFSFIEHGLATVMTGCEAIAALLLARARRGQGGRAYARRRTSRGREPEGPRCDLYQHVATTLAEVHRGRRRNALGNHGRTQRYRLVPQYCPISPAGQFRLRPEEVTGLTRACADRRQKR